MRRAPVDPPWVGQVRCHVPGGRRRGQGVFSGRTLLVNDVVPASARATGVVAGTKGVGVLRVGGETGVGDRDGRTAPSGDSGQGIAIDLDADVAHAIVI